MRREQRDPAINSSSSLCGEVNREGGGVLRVLREGEVEGRGGVEEEGEVKVAPVTVRAPDEEIEEERGGEEERGKGSPTTGATFVLLEEEEDGHKSNG